ncbi:MAG: deoxyribodipyrimidine photo-lyase [Pseudomonadota bacterium]
MPTTTLFWFRRDLRLSDNPGLRAALNGTDTLIPVFIDDSEELGEWAPGAAARVWLGRSIAALSRSLEDNGSRLIVRRGRGEDVLAALIDETGATRVFWNRLYDPARVRRDKALKAALKARGIDARSHKAGLLLEPWEIETQQGEPYQVFTPFWRNAQSSLPPREPWVMPRNFRAPAQWPDNSGDDALNVTPKPAWDEGFWDVFTPGEQSARERLYAFADAALADYKTQRDVPGDDGVSRLSPHLAFGEISPFQIWHIIAKRRDEAPAGADAYLREIGWREFAYHVLFHFPDTPTEPLKDKYRDFPWREDHADALERWQRGRTGIPIVDAGMRQLWRHGWMHNRVRMIVASLLVKNVRAPWLAGARWFWDTLVDADLANNTLGWQWAAGCGADAAPYFRIFNPVLQGEKHDPDGRYVREFVPELGRLPDRYLHKPWELPADTAADIDFELGRDYPAPIVDLKKTRDEALAALKQL